MPRLPLLLLAPLLLGCWRGERSHFEIQNLGSDTMLEVAGAWAEAYDKVQTHTVLSVSGGGSGTGIAAMISGDVDIANSSRQIKPRELQRARSYGQDPLEHKVGYDGIAIYVHRQNPIESLTIAQLRALFGDGGEISRWSQLGVDLEDPSLDPIVLVSRQNNSGTYEYFREVVLGGASGRFKVQCNNLNGSKDVVDFCAKTMSAIGYSGLAYASPEVRMVPVRKTADDPPVAASNDSVLDGSYPIARPLFMYTNGEPQGRILEYLEWIKSNAGQRVLADHGYPPLRKLD